ncbi:DUF1284 domain-containing protein [Lachnobacterium bovis]|uniref:DUF1284 domain-containing protein n=1 Tax=Lachnobacterium bovis TaxID=140626 RepID=A0A1H9SY91_9FIRM|nr:DUF1284 domain-containing protein [Lachnobacterium bovis]SER89846.1 hypothetical protein SAMN02910429_01420 [Lachnobacterium bovis]
MFLKKENKSGLKLRPHHGMCFEFYEGKGYSGEFTDHMGKIIKNFESNPNQIITVTADTDIVCKHCPNNSGLCCESQSKVMKYDNAVLELCNLKDKTTIEYGKFREIVRNKILRKNLRKEICGDCQWNSICEKK